MSVVGAAVAWILMWLGAAQAQPEPWFHPDGTIHYYHAMSRPGGITWSDAADSARDRGGYLATVTSEAENDFLFLVCDSSTFWHRQPGSGALAGPWLGGFQPPGESSPGAGWQWVNRDSFGYTNWSPGEPDNRSDNNVIGFGSSDSMRTPGWRDLDADEDSVRAAFIELSAETTTVGLTRFDSTSSSGYTLFSPMGSTQAWLVDEKGRLVHSWRSASRLAAGVSLLEDGRLLRVANTYNPRFPNGGRVELLNWDGTIDWAYDYSDSLSGQHHDALVMPGGNVLMLAYEMKTRGEAVAAGRDPVLLASDELHPEKVVEIDPATNNIVWEWHLWDHVVQDFDSSKANYGDVAGRPELLDINYLGNNRKYGADDWIHANSIDYNPGLDQVMLSSRNLNEVWVIDHGTTTEQARGHTGGRQGMGGDILYRWGNPQAYRAGDSTARRFFGQHDARWIEPGLPGAGNVMVFNNGFPRPGVHFYSSVDELTPPCDSTGRYSRPEPGAPYDPASLCWSYDGSPGTSFFSPAFSSAQRLPNGNTQMCRGAGGTVTEVTADSQVVWCYVSPMSEDSTPMYQGDLRAPSPPFNARQYAPNYPGLAGRDLTPGYPLERYRPPNAGIAEAPLPGPTRDARLTTTPNPFRTGTTILLPAGIARRARVNIIDAAGRVVRVLAPRPEDGRSIHWDGKDDSGRPVSPGVYCSRYRSGDRTATLKIVKLD